MLKTFFSMLVETEFPEINSGITLPDKIISLQNINNKENPTSPSFLMTSYIVT